ncbi:MAG TPA: ion channel, partial [Saprospiraceae bacterium]|nr:ion channel [Saprospiraceae bacterium]
MKVKNFQEVLSNNRFEFLLFALLLLLFDKIFVPDVNIYTTYIWPFNMIILGFAAVGIFKERFRYIIWIKNVLFILSVLIPLLFFTIVRNPVLVQSAFLVYTFYYTLIFIEVLYQIFRKSEATISVVYGSISGFLLLIVIAQFTFLLIEYNNPNSFGGLVQGNIPYIYNQLSYFSMVTMATVGYGDITPVSDAARLTTMFFTIAGQFYM